MKLLLIGDVMLGRLVNQALTTAPPEYSWGNLLPIFEAADLRFCNLECVISDRGTPWSATPKIFHFRTDEKNAGVLKAARIDGVSLANNHVLDYGEDALQDCIRILDENGILHTGAGANIAEAENPFICEASGVRVGFLAFTDNEPVWAAAENKPGIFYVPVESDSSEVRHLRDLTGELKSRVDILIISAHWGPNWGYNPPKEHIELAHALIDSGADIIYGHSAHVFRGIEIYKGRPIFYSTGNFIDDYAVDEVERNDQSCIFVVETTGSKLDRITLHPTIIDNFQAVQAAGIEAQVILKKMQTLCAELGTNTSGVDERLEIQISR